MVRHVLSMLIQHVLIVLIRCIPLGLLHFAIDGCSECHEPSCDCAAQLFELQMQCKSTPSNPCLVTL
ncbi:hypothetical protein BC831DRAFT_459069 [Entophlyctis helioformis]|nr:hypothetical protein BC831DRAFT_459069 [Entophlyctis helioformis]